MNNEKEQPIERRENTPREKFAITCFVASLISLIIEFIILAIAVINSDMIGVIVGISLYFITPLMVISIIFLIIGVFLGWRTKFIRNAFLVFIGIFFALLIILPNL